MAKYYIKTVPNKFFLFDGKQLSRIVVVGALFGVATALLARFGLTMATELAEYRIALVVMGLVMVGILLWLQVEPAIMIAVASVIVLWRLGLINSNVWWQILLAQGLLSAGIVGLFGWISQLRQWWPRIIATVLVILILSLI